MGLSCTMFVVKEIRIIYSCLRERKGSSTVWVTTPPFSNSPGWNGSLSSIQQAGHMESRAQWIPGVLRVTEI